MCGLIAIAQSRSDVHVGLVAALARIPLGRNDCEVVGRKREFGLGHRHMAILDLVAYAAQAMCSPCRRSVTTFNAKCCSFSALRRGLVAAGVAFATIIVAEVIGLQKPRRIMSRFNGHSREILPAAGPRLPLTWQLQLRRGVGAGIPSLRWLGEQGGPGVSNSSWMGRPTLTEGAA